MKRFWLKILWERWSFDNKILKVNFALYNKLVEIKKSLPELICSEFVLGVKKN